MANSTDALPYIPGAFVISSSLLTSEQLVAQFEDFRSSLRYVSTAPELVFERLVTNLNGDCNAALELERQQHASGLKMTQSTNDELKRTNQGLIQTLGACTCPRTSIPDPPTDKNPTPAPTLAVTTVKTRPNPRIGTFHTNQIHSWVLPRAENSKIISFDRPYPEPPGIPVGLTELDMPNWNLCLESYTSKINTDQFEMHIDSLEDETLHIAGCSWLEIEADDPDFQFGSYYTMEYYTWDRCQTLTSQEITFERAYDAPPVVVVWLTGFNMKPECSCRVETFAEDVTVTGFTINIATWGDTVLYSAVLSWVAYTAGIPGVCSGRFSTRDLHSRQSKSSGYENFGENVFSARPRTMLAINSLDVDRGQSLRLLVKALSVSVEGMKWDLDAPTTTKINAVGTSYIAMS